ncbi:polysaccharide deacetylase family protein [Sphaerisporangium flaviroseum]|uniref:Polysaccharide deacetylase family protein n=1 Tax=Sphaerisporangium flaviroseum TaxID=509199 RepID=A0ABP7JD56_9ACTN
MRRWIPIVLAAAATLTAAPTASAQTSGPSIAAQTSRPSAAAVNCAKVKCIALTFDDGPGPYTGKLLDLLRKHHTKVSFFLVGTRVEKYGKIARRMAREGHEIGNHTYDHPHLTSLPDDEIEEQLGRTQDLIERATGQVPGIMRPPYGDTDDRVGSVATELGLSQILWNASSRDWELRDSAAITKKVVGLAKRNRVVLMHDVWPETVKAMPKILSTLKKKGYHVVPVKSLLRGKELGAGEIYPVGGWR